MRQVKKPFPVTFYFQFYLTARLLYLLFVFSFYRQSYQRSTVGPKRSWKSLCYQTLCLIIRCSETETICSFENANKKTCEHTSRVDHHKRETSQDSWQPWAGRACRYVVPTVAGLNCFIPEDDLRDDLHISDCYCIPRLSQLFTTSVWGFWDYQISLKPPYGWPVGAILQGKLDAVSSPGSPKYTSLMDLCTHPVITWHAIKSNNWAAVVKNTPIYSSGLWKGRKRTSWNIFSSVILNWANVYSIYKCWTFFSDVFVVTPKF